jgi:DNA-binding transcriptional LysR family regulator
MDMLEGMAVFVRVARRSGFAAAGRELRMSPAAVSKHIAALEARVGARLLDRTTRRVGLTEAGRVYLERCQECLQAVADADASVGALAGEPRGVLRVAAPVDLQAHLSPIVSRFLEAHPAVTVDLRLSNRGVDLVEEGFDVAVRVAAALDGTHIARLLARVEMGLYAAPAYLARHGRPRAPADVERHRGLVFAEPSPRDEWILERNGRQQRARLRPVLVTNSGDAIRAALVDSVGIAAAPSFWARAVLDAGLVEPLLPEWRVLPELRLFAVYPHRRFVAPKVAAFVAALRDASAALGGAGDGEPRA